MCLQSKRGTFIDAISSAVVKHPEIVQMNLIHAMHTIGSIDAEHLKPYKTLFEKLQTNPRLSVYCERCLDLIAGRRYYLAF